MNQKLPQWNQLTVGAEYRKNSQQDFNNYDVNILAPNLDLRQHLTIWGLYAQDEIALGKKLVLNLGVRHDRYPTFGGTTNPRLALIYTPRQ